VAISALALVPSSVIAHHGSDAAKQAAADIQAAQDRANDASQAMFDAESDIDGLGIDIAATDMQDGLEAQAVRSFVGAGSGGDFDLFIDFDDSNDSNDSNDSLTADVMSAMTRETAHDDLPESVRFTTNNLGGNAIWLTGNSGATYYYAHLNASKGWKGSSRPESTTPATTRCRCGSRVANPTTWLPEPLSTSVQETHSMTSMVSLARCSPRCRSRQRCRPISSASKPN
jgi:hypothetical protein